MSNKLSLLESFILEKCTDIQAYFIYNLVDLVTPSTSVLKLKINDLLELKPIYNFTKTEFSRTYHKHYFDTIILNLIKPYGKLMLIPIIQLNLAMELHKQKISRKVILKYITPNELLINSLQLWFDYQEEKDPDKKKLLASDIKKNNLLVTALHHEHKVMFIRYAEELYNLTRTIYYRNDPIRNENILVIRKAIRNLVDNELAILEITK